MHTSRVYYMYFCMFLFKKRNKNGEWETSVCTVVLGEPEVMAALSVSWRSTHSSHYTSVSCSENLEIISSSSFLPYVVVPLSLAMRKVGDNYFHFTSERTKSQRFSVTEREPRTQAPWFSQELSVMIRIHSWPLGGDNLLRENIDKVSIPFRSRMYRIWHQSCDPLSTWSKSCSRASECL